MIFSNGDSCIHSSQSDAVFAINLQRCRGRWLGSGGKGRRKEYPRAAVPHSRLVAAG